MGEHNESYDDRAYTSSRIARALDELIATFIPEAIKHAENAENARLSAMLKIIRRLSSRLADDTHSLATDMFYEANKDSDRGKKEGNE